LPRERVLAKPRCPGLAANPRDRIKFGRPPHANQDPAVNKATFMLAWMICFALPAASSGAADLDFSTKDGQVLGRTLAYLGDGMSGIAVVGVAFAPADQISHRDAEVIQAVVGDGLNTGRIRRRVLLVPVEQLAKVTGINALYVTSGMTASMATISGAAQRLHVPTIAANLACVQSGECIVGFSSEPTVQILIDQHAAERTGVRFVQAFRMLVREK
jgi:hypothetical protein